LKWWDTAWSSTADIAIPQDPLKRVIGQDEAVELARVAASQRRHLLLVGPPGTGKSMIAQALALHLNPAEEEVHIVSNPENPDRPFVELKELDEVQRDREDREGSGGKIVSPVDVPVNIAEQLGYRCPHCGTYSPPSENQCPNCQVMKPIPGAQKKTGNPFGDLMGVVQLTINQIGGKKKPERVQTTREVNGKEEVVVYEQAGDRIRVLDERSLGKRRRLEGMRPRKVLVPIDRKTFVMATGASETELLGDVRHDPYGGHEGLGTPAFERVVAGAVHDAHQGVLFLDELPHLGALQRNILTAMQEKSFPISGRNPQSAGASVRVDSVPCDFIFVGACNITDLPSILAPLRSRILGSGYEVLVETAMEDNTDNRRKLAQFVAQEVNMDGRIPHASRSAVEEIVRESGKRAKVIDGAEGALTLRLRELGGLVRVAGDLAIRDGSDLIDKKHVKRALRWASPIEDQIKERYGSYMGGVARDISGAQKEGTSPYNYWNQHLQDDKQGYG